MTYLMMMMSTLLVYFLVMRASASQPYGGPRTFENNGDDDSIFDHEDNDDLGFLADQGTEEDLQRNSPSIRQWKWPVMPWTIIELPMKRTATARTTTKKPKVVSTTQSPQISGCGTNNANGKINQNKIVGGHKVAPNWKYPWMVAIIAKKRLQMRWRHLCGGALISKRHILTASHCFPTDRNYKAHDLKVRLGESDMDSGYVKSASRRDVAVSAIFLHEDFDEMTFKNDIAILKLEDEIENWTDFIRPICLATEPWNLEGRMATAAGWGDLLEGTLKVSQYLMEVDLPIIGNRECEEIYSAEKEPIFKEQICAGYPEGGKDTCQGDSGGPLMFRKDRNKPWTVIGVVSWGTGCGRKGVPGVYARVESYYHWIQSKMAIA